MAGHSATHGSFTIERVFDAPVALVFQAFADKTHKARWFKGPPEWRERIREQDFRVGGADRLAGEWSGTSRSWTTSDFTARYCDIVENARIVYVYEMTIDGRKISVSLATVEFKPTGKGTRLTVTEQGAFLDGYEDADKRKDGVSAQIDMLEAILAPRH